MEPGKIIVKFKSKKNREVILRTPLIKDAAKITDMINSIIEEDDYILLNKKVELEAEIKWLKGKIEGNKGNDNLYLVVEVDDIIIGSIDINKLPGRTNHVGNLGIAIREGFREEGIGTRIMEEMIDYAKEKMGIKIAKLEVYKTNLRALNLYKKLGFIEFGEVPNEIKIKKEYVNGIYMYKELK